MCRPILLLSAVLLLFKVLQYRVLVLVPVELYYISYLAVTLTLLVSVYLLCLRAHIVLHSPVTRSELLLVPVVPLCTLGPLYIAAIFVGEFRRSVATSIDILFIDFALVFAAGLLEEYTRFAILSVSTSRIRYMLIPVLPLLTSGLIFDLLRLRSVIDIGYILTSRDLVVLMEHTVLTLVAVKMHSVFISVLLRLIMDSLLTLAPCVPHTPLEVTTILFIAVVATTSYVFLTSQEIRIRLVVSTYAYVLVPLLVLVCVASTLKMVRPVIITSPSMYPTLKIGDLVLIKKIHDVTELRPGDIVMYFKKVDSRYVPIVHRLLNITEINGRLYVICKGDANSIPDDPVPINLVWGKVILTIPGGGYILQFVQVHGRLIVIMLIVMIGAIAAYALLRREKKAEV